MSIGRNDPCPCGSGKKYKKCCEAKDEAKVRETLDKQWAEAAKKKEEEDKKTEKQKEGKSPAALRGSQTPTSSNVVPQKHQSVTTPKYNMPRKSGGG